MIGSGDLGMGISVYVIDEFTSGSSRIGSSVQNLESKFKSAAAGIDRGIGQIRTGIGGLLAAAAIAAPLLMAVSASADFNHTISKVGAIANATSEDLVKLKDSALDLGASTQFSAQKVAEAQTFLAMAGFNTRQNIAAMPSVLNLAASASIDLARASDIASDTLSMFSIQADNAARVADVMAKTTTTANTNMEQMFDAMRFLGPTAHALGVSFEETSAAIGLLADQGLKGSDATASLQTAMLRLTKPSKEMTEVMSQLGLDFFDARGEFVGLSGMIGQLEKGFVGLTKEQKANAIATIFGARSAKQIFTLMNSQKTIMEDGTEAVYKGSEALKQYTGVLERSGGAAAEMARRMNDNLKGSFIAFRSAVETAVIRVGDALEPLVKPIVEFGTRVVRMLSAIAAHPIGKWVVALASGLLVFGAVAMGVTAIITAIIPGLITLAAATWAALAPLLPFIAIGAAVVGVFYGMHEAINSSNEGWQKFGLILAASLGPIGWIVGGIMAAKRGIEEFKKVLDGGDAASGTLGFFQKIGGAIMGLMEVWNSWNGSTFELSAKMHDALEKIGILDFVLAAGTWLVRIKEFFGGFMSGISSVWDTIKGAFGKIIDAFGPLWDAITDLVGLFFDLDITMGKAGGTTEQWAAIGKTLADFLVTGLKIAIEMVSLGLRGLIGVVTAVISAFVWLWDSVGKLFSGEMSFADFGRSMVSGLWEGIKGAWQFLKDGLAGLISALPFGDKILSFFGGEVSPETDPGNVTGSGEDRTTGLMGDVNSATARQRANEKTSSDPTIIDKSTITTENVTTIIELDGEVIHKNIKNREALEDARS